MQTSAENMRLIRGMSEGHLQVAFHFHTLTIIAWLLIFCVLQEAITLDSIFPPVSSNDSNKLGCCAGFRKYGLCTSVS